MDTHNMTGLEIVEAYASGDLATPTLFKAMPIKMVLIEKGYVIFEVTPDQGHCDFLGKVHSGYAATVLDAATACATRTMLDVGQTYNTIDLSLKICQTIPRDSTLIVEAKIVNCGRKLIIAEGTLKDASGFIYAYMTANSIIVKV